MQDVNLNAKKTSSKSLFAKQTNLNKIKPSKTVNKEVVETDIENE